MKINEKIKALRIKEKMTQQEFADSIGVTRGHITNIESGRVPPTQLMINCIALMYGVDKSWFLDDSCDNMDGLKDPSERVIVENYKKLKGEYKLIAEKHMEMLLELQLKEEKISENSTD